MWCRFTREGEGVGRGTQCKYPVKRDCTFLRHLFRLATSLLLAAKCNARWLAGDRQRRGRTRSRLSQRPQLHVISTATSGADEIVPDIAA